jgi:hypothetical protein
MIYGAVIAFLIGAVSAALAGAVFLGPTIWKELKKNETKSEIGPYMSV